MAEQPTKDVKVLVTLKVRESTPDARVQRTVDTLALYARGMGYVEGVEAEIQKPAKAKRAAAQPAEAKE